METWIVLFNCRFHQAGLLPAAVGAVRVPADPGAGAAGPGGAPARHPHPLRQDQLPEAGLSRRAHFVIRCAQPAWELCVIIKSVPDSAARLLLKKK